MTHTTTNTGWSTAPALDEFAWFTPTHRKRDCHSSIVMLNHSDRANTSIAYRPWRSGMTRQDVTTCVSTSIFNALYERIPA